MSYTYSFRKCGIIAHVLRNLRILRFKKRRSFGSKIKMRSLRMTWGCHFEVRYYRTRTKESQYLSFSKALYLNTCTEESQYLSSSKVYKLSSPKIHTTVILECIYRGSRPIFKTIFWFQYFLILRSD